MSVLNPNSDEEPLECPLCMEFLELDDINFYPCSCCYQVLETRLGDLRVDLGVDRPRVRLVRGRRVTPIDSVRSADAMTYFILRFDVKARL